MVRPYPSGDLGLVVKSLTKPVIAGSFPNVCQDSLTRDKQLDIDTD